MEVIMKKLFLLLSLLLSSNQLLVSAEQSSEQPQSSGSGKNTTCLICGKVFSKMSNLTRHMQGHTTANLSRTHDKFKGLQCQYCGDTFTVLPSKYKHIQRRHPEVILPNHKYECSCKGKFRLKDELIGHKARSTDKRCRGDYTILDNESSQLNQQQALAEEAARKEEEIQRIVNELKALAQKAIEEEEIRRIARELQEASYLEI
ncbi:MAG: C2H2-type zinc finger protein [Proteobacteria bacterium]|nr:C2H2-type zinc finger protein [Pseudomonadota bacterium]NBP15526.1 C2H2-type zinc finger protein [bacterium]